MPVANCPFTGWFCRYHRGGYVHIWTHLTATDLTVDLGSLDLMVLEFVPAAWRLPAPDVGRPPTLPRGV